VLGPPDPKKRQAPGSAPFPRSTLRKKALSTISSTRIRSRSTRLGPPHFRNTNTGASPGTTSQPMMKRGASGSRWAATGLPRRPPPGAIMSPASAVLTHGGNPSVSVQRRGLRVVKTRLIASVTANRKARILEAPSIVPKTQRSRGFKQSPSSNRTSLRMKLWRVVM
jgi:hypothetical protein